MRLLRLSPLLSVLVLLAPVASSSAQQGARQKFPIDRPVVLEVDARGEIVWRLDDIAAPWDVAVRDGRRLVVDRAAGLVRTYGRDGRVSLELRLADPVDADFVGDENILVTGQQGGWLREFDPAGRVVWEISGLDHPFDAERLENGNTLVAERGRVVEVGRDGRANWSYKRGLNRPSKLDVDSQDNVLIADFEKHWVSAVDRGRRLLWRAGQIGRPNDLQFLADGSVLVSASNTGMIVRIDKQHRQVDRWRLGGVIRSFDVSPDGRLIVALEPGEAAGKSAAFSAARAGEIARLGRGEPLRRAKRNLVLVLFDSLRWNHVPWHGYWRNTAPNLNELARGSLVFDQYITQSSWTKPSVASLFTSTHPSEHGVVRQTPDSRLDDSFVTLAEALREAGYFTAALVENPHMGEGGFTNGLDQGFTTYEYYSPITYKGQLPEIIGDRFVRLLDERPLDRPFFLLVFLLNPHFPYEPKQPYFGASSAGPGDAEPINDYDGEIFDADQQVGRIITALQGRDLLDGSLFVFSTDHGEEFADHGSHIGHGSTLYDCVLRVPLLIRGLGRNGRFPGLAREIDLMPTLLDYLQVPVTAETAQQMQGVSLRPFVEAGARRTGLVAYSESEFADDVHLVSKRTESAKLIVDRLHPGLERYDLESDPQEYSDLRALPGMRAELLGWYEQRQARATAAPDLDAQMEREEREAILRLERDRERLLSRIKRYREERSHGAPR